MYYLAPKLTTMPKGDALSILSVAEGEYYRFPNDDTVYVIMHNQNRQSGDLSPYFCAVSKNGKVVDFYYTTSGAANFMMLVWGTSWEG